MEQETHTRLLFPGAFAVGTFILLAFAWDAPVKTLLFGSWQSMLVALLITVPTLGFVADLLRYKLRNYDRDVFYRYPHDYIRYEIKRAVAQSARSQGVPGIGAAEIENMSSESVYIVVVRGGWSQDILRPKDLTENIRRRWTVVWAAWNSEMGILLGICAFAIYVLHFTSHGFGKWHLEHGWPTEAGLSLIPFVVGWWLEQSGRRSRDSVVDVERLWAQRFGLKDRLVATSAPSCAAVTTHESITPAQ